MITNYGTESGILAVDGKIRVGRRIDGITGSGTLTHISDANFTVQWDDGTIGTYDIERLQVDNLMGNLRVR